MIAWVCYHCFVLIFTTGDDVVGPLQMAYYGTHSKRNNVKETTPITQHVETTLANRACFTHRSKTTRNRSRIFPTSLSNYRAQAG